MITDIFNWLHSQRIRKVRNSLPKLKWRSLYHVFLLFFSTLTACSLFAAAVENKISDAATKKEIIDIHVHVAGLGYGNSGCFINREMRENFRFPVYLWAMGVTQEELEQFGDQILFDKLSSRITSSKMIDKAVILAMDGYVTDKGILDKDQTQIYVPNDFVHKQTVRFENLWYGASINPNRKDAIARLKTAHANGAVLIKWIPSIMNIDPSDPKHIPFYKLMAELGLALLSHTGMEKSFANANNELADPLRLSLPLDQGVNVIAAHISTTGESDGQDNFERILPMFNQYPNLYTDISSLTQVNKLGYMARALQVQGLTQRMVYGTDWPLQFSPLVSSWYHINHIGFSSAYDVSGIENAWDRDFALKKAFGVPNEVFLRTDVLLRSAGKPAK